MKFTLSWLKQFIETDASLTEITNCLTMIGLEVEEITDYNLELLAFEVAEILSTEKHPDADKLQICQVKTRDGVNQIVCGASNARAGIKVVLAKEGVTIPNGNFTIKKTKIRGVDSNGMLCSADELGIGKNSDGIIELENNAEVGESFIYSKGLDDPVIHINITPNRADALGVYGIARDLAAAGIGILKDPQIPNNLNNFATKHTLKIEDHKACPFFSMREIKNVNKKHKTPRWLSNLLENIGIGSISPIVDVTNYISYSFGQPMHAYDADKVGENFTVSLLKESQKFSALNDKEYQLPEASLVIADDNEIHCLAGIIGGSHSACQENTNRILLEAACFKSDNIAITGRELQINTDSRYRFERNVNSEFTIKALEIATSMILEICGGEASNIITDGNDSLPEQFIEFSSEFLYSKTEISLELDEISEILTKLGFECSIRKIPEMKKNPATEVIYAKVPSWRYDVKIKEDLVEEIIRIYGYDNIPEIPLSNDDINRIIPKEKRRISEIKRVLATHGYDEVISWSFTDSKIAKLFGNLKQDLFLQNPISADLDYMRNSIIPNLCKMAKLNINRGYNNLSFFEIGPVFEDSNVEDNIINAAAIRYGDTAEKNCFNSQRSFDVYDIKADLQSVLAIANIDINKCQIREDVPSYYHPTKSASVCLGKTRLAIFGQLNPMVLNELDINKDVYAFEVNVNNLPIGKDKFGMRPEFIISNYQSVIRDFAFIIDKEIKVGDVIRIVESIDRKLIKKVNLFDIYIGKNLGENKKSIALSVEMQDDTKTLTDVDITFVSNKIIREISNRFDATLRDS